MADIKSLRIILSELKAFVRSKHRSIDISQNSLITDLLLTPLAVGGSLIMKQIEVIKNLHIISLLSGSDLEDEATNFKLERSLGEYAIVDLTFWSSTKPVTAVSINAGVQARTAGSTYDSPKTFSTISDYEVPYSDLDSYYSYDRGRYEFVVSAVCDTVGSDGNAGANLVSELATTVEGVDGVTNLNASYNGSDAEDDSDLMQRVELENSGRTINTVKGIKSVLVNWGFLDANTIAVEETGYERANGVDAFVIDDYTQAKSDVFTYAQSQKRYYFNFRPVITVTSVKSASLGILSSSLYSISIDSDSPTRRSKYAMDYIEFSDSAAIPPGDQITLTYEYAYRVKQCQDFLEESEENVKTANHLIKRAYPKFLAINASLTLKANADGPTTRNKCRNALSQYCARYRLGDDIQKSDLIVVLQNGFGDYPINNVDAVVINKYYVTDEFGVTIVPVNEVITIDNKGYVVYGSATLS